MPTTVELLQAKARDIWKTIPEVRSGDGNIDNMPVFGKSWVTLFRKRYHIQRHKFHSESSTAEAIRQMEEVA